MKLKNIALLGIVAFLFIACTDKDNAQRVLRDEGYMHISIQGYNLWGCHKDDVFRTGFSAINKNGKAVKGTVCRGLFSGSIIRIK